MTQLKTLLNPAKFRSQENPCRAQYILQNNACGFIEQWSQYPYYLFLVTLCSNRCMAGGWNGLQVTLVFVQNEKVLLLLFGG